MRDAGPDGSGVGAADRAGTPTMSSRSERAEDLEAKALQDHVDPVADETERAREAERIAQQPYF